MSGRSLTDSELRAGHAWYIAKPERRCIDVAQHYGKGSEGAWRDGFAALGLPRKRPGGHRSPARLSPEQERDIALRIIERRESYRAVMEDARIGEHRLMGILARHGYDIAAADPLWPGEAQVRRWHAWYEAEEARTIDDVVAHAGASRTRLRRWFGYLGLAFKAPRQRVNQLFVQPPAETLAKRQCANAEAAWQRAVILKQIEDADYRRARRRRQEFGVFRRRSSGPGDERAEA